MQPMAPQKSEKNPTHIHREKEWHPSKQRDEASNMQHAADRNVLAAACGGEAWQVCSAPDKCSLHANKLQESDSERQSERQREQERDGKHSRQRSCVYLPFPLPFVVVSNVIRRCGCCSCPLLLLLLRSISMLPLRVNKSSLLLLLLAL